MDLFIALYAVNMPKRGFYYSTLKDWNDIPADIREPSHPGA